MSPRAVFVVVEGRLQLTQGIRQVPLPKGLGTLGGKAPRNWLRTKANSIEGGTSEVMLNVISKRILDLPGA